MDVEGLVLKETQAWVTEFQNNIAQMEKELKLQLDRIKTDSDKANQAHATANVPGFLEATIVNANKTDNFQIDAVLESRDAVVASESISNLTTWVKLNIPPGQYKLTFKAKASGKPISVAAIVIVKPNETAKPTLELPI